MQQCLKPYGCGDTSKTVLKIVCFGKSVFCRKNRDAPIVLNVTVSAATNRRDPRGYNAACKVATLRNSAERGTQSHRLCAPASLACSVSSGFHRENSKDDVFGVTFR